jgi:hypothetical protein
MKQKLTKLKETRVQQKYVETSNIIVSLIHRTRQKNTEIRVDHHCKAPGHMRL